MKTVRQKAFAKLNLFLDIVGESNGFHMLDSVVTTVSLYDEVIVSTRKDGKIVLKTQGSLYSVTQGVDNNVYRAAEAFRKKYGTLGADVTLHKFIPVSSGMGGSSADIVATIVAMKKLYGVDCDLKELADSLGSDAGYLLSGGFARLTGRGENVSPIDTDKKMYFTVAVAEGGVNTAACYKKYDEITHHRPATSAEEFIKKLSDGTLCGSDYHNALYAPAKLINPNVEKVFDTMLSLSPNGAGMTGSGSGVFGVFETVELCRWAAEKMRAVAKDVFVCESVLPEKEEKSGLFGRNIYSLD